MTHCVVVFVVALCAAIFLALSAIVRKEVARIVLCVCVGVVQFAASVSLQKAYAWCSVTDAMRAASLGLCCSICRAA